jgi:hypothetical protein
MFGVVGPATHRVRETTELVEKKKRGRNKKSRDDGSLKEHKRMAIVSKGGESSGMSDGMLFGTRDAS